MKIDILFYFGLGFLLLQIWNDGLIFGLLALPCFIVYKVLLNKKIEKLKSNSNETIELEGGKKKKK